MQHNINKTSISIIFCLSFGLSYASENTPESLLAINNGIEVSVADINLLYGNSNSNQKLHISQTEEALEQFILKTIRQRKISQEARNLKLDTNITTILLIEKATNKILEQQLVAHIRKNIPPPQDTEALAQEYYNTHPEHFIIKEKVNASHILFKFDNNDEKDSKLTLARNVLSKIKNGLDFSIAAEKYSDDIASAKSGGNLGFFEHGKMVKEFEVAAFKIKKVNQLSDIIESPFGFHIIKLIERKKAEKQSYQSVKDKLKKLETKNFINSQLKKQWEVFNSDKETTLFMKNIKKLYKDIDTLKQ